MFYVLSTCDLYTDSPSYMLSPHIPCLYASCTVRDISIIISPEEKRPRVTNTHSHTGKQCDQLCTKHEMEKILETSLPYQDMNPQIWNSRSLDQFPNRSGTQWGRLYDWKKESFLGSGECKLCHKLSLFFSLRLRTKATEFSLVSFSFRMFVWSEMHRFPLPICFITSLFSNIVTEQLFLLIKIRFFWFSTECQTYSSATITAVL
jgi:hypothetical protein